MYNYMGHGKYKAVFSDIDGTLLNASHRVPVRTRERIQQVNRQGIPFVLVSARMPDGMIGIQQELNIKSPMICYNGALILDEEKNPIYSASLDSKDAKEICAYIKKDMPDICINLYSNNNWMVEDLENEWVVQEMQITGVQAQEVSLEEKRSFVQIHKILCMGEVDHITFLEKALKEQYPKLRIYRSKDTYLEIMSIKAAKSVAIHQLGHRFGVAREEILAFGDEHNDKDMLIYAGCGVAMGNASKEVKEIADYVTEQNDKEGLRKVLDQCYW